MLRKKLQAGAKSREGKGHNQVPKELSQASDKGNLTAAPPGRRPADRPDLHRPDPGPGART